MYTFLSSNRSHNPLPALPELSAPVAVNPFPLLPQPIGENMNQKRLLGFALAALCAAVLLATSSNAQKGRGRTSSTAAATPDNGCGLPFTGKPVSRKDVKLRKPGLDYTKHAGGRAISVSDFLAFACTLDPKVPTLRKDVSTTEAMDIEQ